MMSLKKIPLAFMMASSLIIQASYAMDSQDKNPNSTNIKIDKNTLHINLVVS